MDASETALGCFGLFLVELVGEVGVSGGYVWKEEGVTERSCIFDKKQGNLISIKFLLVSYVK